MKTWGTTLLILLSLFISSALATGLNHLIKLDESASSWIVHDGTPIYYTAVNGLHYRLADHVVTKMSYYDPDIVFGLSPQAEYRLISHLESMEQVKEGKRYSNYFVINKYDELMYKISRWTGSDLKAPVAAVSDQGVLALVDPISAQISLYQEGEILAETQLYGTNSDYSLERKVRVQWQNDRCYVLIERPGENGSAPGNVIFISLNAQGLDQITKILPFTYLQQIVIKNNRFFISGYSYSPAAQKMSPLILETDFQGNVLWTNENFGHELVVSENAKFLAARSSHSKLMLFDLENERVEEISFMQDGKAALGLSVDNTGKTALIRVNSDFFVKRNTYFSEVFFPESGESLEVQMDPKYPHMFQLHSDGNQFYLGTKHEWLELSE